MIKSRVPCAPRTVAEPCRDTDVWVFDLDNTLYPADCDLFSQIDKRMKAFIANLLKVDYEEAHRVQKAFFRSHGTTLRGLMTHHGVNPAEFLAYVHDIDFSPLSRRQRLETALDRLRGRKFVFTNANTSYAERVLDRLGIRRHFEAIFDIADAGFVPKPDIAPYRELIARHGIDPIGTVMVEDLARNLAPAAALGMTTVWVPNGMELSGLGADDGHVHHVVENLETWLCDLTAP